MHIEKNQNRMGRRAVEGDSPVRVEDDVYKSRAGHEKSCLKKGRPLSKAKYY